jgi:hypothetical protein
MTGILTVLLLHQTTLGVYKQDVSMLERRYATLNSAIASDSKAGIVKWLHENLAPDFFMRSANGDQFSMATTSKMMEGEMAVINSVKTSKSKVGNVSIHPDHISCSVKTHLDATTKDGKRIVEDSLAVDTWKPLNQKWKLVSIVTTKDRVKVNGRIVRVMGLKPGEAFP